MSESCSDETSDPLSCDLLAVDCAEDEAVAKDRTADKGGVDRVLGGASVEIGGDLDDSSKGTRRSGITAATDWAACVVVLRAGTYTSSSMTWRLTSQISVLQKALQIIDLVSAFSRAFEY